MSTLYLLSIEHKPSGYTEMVFDAGVTRRLTLTVPTESLHLALDVSVADAIGRVGSTMRPPTARRGKAT